MGVETPIPPKESSRRPEGRPAAASITVFLLSLIRIPFMFWGDPPAEECSVRIARCRNQQYIPCSSTASMSTSASIASATGTMRGAMQGSCLPPTEISTTLP
jgi:hypothetical protein